MNINKLLQALEDDSNETLLNFNSEKIVEINLNILKELHLSRTDTLDILKKLKNYKYVDEMNELKYGTYIRWISIENENNIYLTKGAIFCEIKIADDGVFCICKNYGSNVRHFQIAMDKNLIFQKLTSQELVLLSALDHLTYEEKI
jgi:hypothetical protein